GWREKYGDNDINTTSGIPGFNTNTDEQSGQSPRGKSPLIVELGIKLWGAAILNGKEYRFGVDQSKVIDPRRGAWFDFTTNEGGFIRDLMKKIETAATQSQPPLIYVDIAKWIDAPVPQRQWAVLNRIPAKNVTVLSGTGGTGKTIIAM